MMYSWAAFQEPRGVMRILQFIFAICAFATTTNFTATVSVSCRTGTDKMLSFDYPFRIGVDACPNPEKNNTFYTISADVSSDAQFYVATGVLSLMYCVFIVAVYAVLDELYRTKSEIPLADFMLTTILAIFWLSGSAAWSNGTNALKAVTDPIELTTRCNCPVTTGSFSRLNISLILGYLNFFLWASDLWFLYKETIWFQGRSAAGQPTGTTPTGSMAPPNV